MKIIIASSDKNRIEERVAVYSLLQCGHQADEIEIIDGDSGLVYDAMREGVVRETGILGLGQSTSFTLARLFLPLYYEEDRIVIIDSDIVAYQHLGRIFGENAEPGIYVRKAYAPGEWATSVMGWVISDEVKKRFPEYRQLIEGTRFSWRDKIYLKPDFVNAIGLKINKIDKNWNSFDSLTEVTKLLHFTNLATQPWKRPGHPLEHEWFSMAQEAYKQGALKQEDIDVQNSFGSIIISGQRLLRLDFEKKLNSTLVKEGWLGQLKHRVLLFYRNLKFHSPMKYLYSEFVR